MGYRLIADAAMVLHSGVVYPHPYELAAQIVVGVVVVASWVGFGVRRQ